MSKLNLTSAALMLLLCCHLVSSQEVAPTFASPGAFVKSILKAEETLSAQAKGDLNGDGRADWVGVIHRQRPDFGSTDQMYVLLRSSPAGYRLAAESTEAEIPGMGCCWHEDLRVRNGSIYSQENAKTCCTMEAATHQFKLHKGEWRLVGVRIYYTEMSPKSMTTDTDMNLLTGSVTEKKQRGNRKAVIRRSRKKFAVSFLKDYDFSNTFGLP